MELFMTKLPPASILMMMSVIDKTLIEDIENYLWSLDERKTDIALSRWGYNNQRESLEKIAVRYGVTRERVRQNEIQVNSNLVSGLRIHPKVLWANIQEKMTSDLTRLLPQLARCFDTPDLFYAFIELCCQVKRGAIKEIVLPKVDQNILVPFFCNTPSPVPYEMLADELMSNFGLSKALAAGTLRELTKLGAIEVSEDGVVPRNMDKKAAAAHALMHHPAGLPWKDIAKVVNAHNYSHTVFNENRLVSNYLSGSDMIYLCGKGTYRHLMFLDLSRINIDEVMQHLLAWFRTQKLRNIHLYDYFYQTQKDRPNIEYFTLRHLVRTYGEDYGLYFSGRSNADSVSLEQDGTQITQKDVILQVLKKAPGAMTRREIAKRLRSKSINHAACHLAVMQNEGKAVRVDEIMYTIPEKAFKDVDQTAIMHVIKSIMALSDRIVESDVFREQVNRELNLSYAKYFYAALVKTQAKTLGWHNKHNLFSTKPIPYSCLFDVCKVQCRLPLSPKENVKRICELVWLTDSVAERAVYSWKVRASRAAG